MSRKTLRLLRLTVVAAITILALFWFAINPQPKVQQAAIASVMPADPLMVNPVAWSSLAAPIHPVKGTDGQIHLIYGLSVTNGSRHDVQLTKSR